MHHPPTGRIVLAAALLLALTIGGGTAHADDAGERAAAAPIAAESLPWGFELVSSYSAGAEQLRSIGAALGVNRLAALHNQVVRVRGLSAKVNTILCESTDDAGAVEKTLTTNAPAIRLTVRSGKRVYEILSRSTELRLFCRSLVDAVDATGTTYSIAVDPVLVDGGDYAVANELFNRILHQRRTPDDAANAKRIGELAAEFTPGARLALAPTGKRQTWLGDITTEPAPAKRSPAGGAVILHYDSAALETVAGLPTVRLTGKLRVAPAYEPFTAPPSGPADLAADARFAPTKLAAVRRAITAAYERAGIDPETAGRRSKVAALHRWVVETIRYGGANPGSRLGVETVLKTRQGRCWDLCDVFVTLCRADGIPARQVAGWLVGGSGHIWCEVELSRGSWLGVDATTPWLGLSESYIALWPADRPIIYAALPTIDEVAPADGDDDGAAQPAD
jgi:hypothetical protein